MRKYKYRDIRIRYKNEKHKYVVMMSFYVSKTVTMRYYKCIDKNLKQINSL